MGLRPGHCYRKLERPYTRVSRAVPRKNYVGAIPHLVIHRFESGNPNGSYDIQLHLITEDSLQIRQNALEAARVAATRFLEKKIGKSNFFLKLRVFPHHILRENKMLTGAGADRLQKGMKKAFGRPVGRAAQVKEGQKLFTLKIRKEHEEFGKEALRRAASKLPCHCKIVCEAVA